MIVRIHVHDFKIIYPNVVGVYQKGTRERLEIFGDYKECKCREAIFVPRDKNLREVPCECVK